MIEIIKEQVKMPSRNSTKAVLCDVCHLSDMMAQITKKFAEAEENIIKEVLRQILKREPTLEDAKELVHLYKQKL